MAEERTNRRTVLTLGSVLGLALLVIAFLLGRESNRVSPSSDANVSEALPSVPELDPADPERGPEHVVDSPTSWDDLDDDQTPYGQVDARETSSARIERRPDGTIVLSNISDDEAASAEASPSAKVEGATPPDTPQSVAKYFKEMDAIRSGEDVGDPNSFAMGLIKAGMSGSTAGFDQLIIDTERMEEEMRSVAPPPSCQRYHEVNLDALAEGRAILEELKSALSTRDIQKLTAVAQQARTLESRADQLKEMEKEIRAKY